MSVNYFQIILNGFWCTEVNLSTTKCRQSKTETNTKFGDGNFTKVPLCDEKCAEVCL